MVIIYCLVDLLSMLSSFMVLNSHIYFVIMLKILVCMCLCTGMLMIIGLAYMHKKYGGEVYEY